MTHLFSPLVLRGVTLRNRVMMSPMCMYCAEYDGRLTAWHHAHYLARAVGGAGLIITEATAVEARGRISAHDIGLWDDAQVGPLTQLADLVHAQGVSFGVQLAHAGRKAWSSERGYGDEMIIGPAVVPFGPDWQTPHELDPDEIHAVTEAWRNAAVRADAAGCDVIELHGAHGYLIHQFLSPIANHRHDTYGGDLNGRMRFLLEVVDAVRQVWPEHKPLFVRLSTTDWLPEGLTIEDSVTIAASLCHHGVDLIDSSTGGISPDSRPESPGPGYQTPFAAQIRREAGIPTGAVGLITAPEHADAIIQTEQADLVILGRELLRHPYWTLEAAHTLGYDIAWPKQYLRAKR